MALAIVALVLAVTPPLFTAAVPGIELKASARRVTAGLRLAREVAIRSGRDVAFTLDLEARTFEIGSGFRNGKLPQDLVLKLEAAQTEQLSEHRGRSASSRTAAPPAGASSWPWGIGVIRSGSNG